jgi:lysozyme
VTLSERQKLRLDVMAAEACRLKPYSDKVGKLTIGYGRNLDDVGLSKIEAEILLDHDLAVAERGVAVACPWFHDLTAARQRVVIEMAFNLGLTRFLGFNRMIAAVEAQNYDKAATEMLASKWAQQVGERAQRLARAMRKGL